MIDRKQGVNGTSHRGGKKPEREIAPRKPPDLENPSQRLSDLAQPRRSSAARNGDTEKEAGNGKVAPTPSAATERPQRSGRTEGAGRAVPGAAPPKNGSTADGQARPGPK